MDDGPTAAEEALPAEKLAASPAKPTEEPAAEPEAAPEAAAPAAPTQEPAAPQEEPSAVPASGGKKPTLGAKRKGMAVGAGPWWVLLVGAARSLSLLGAGLIH